MKLANFKPSLVTKHVFPNYKDPEVINQGECFIWAYSAYLIFQGVEIWHAPCHAFVKYRNRFYDSESLKGEQSYRDLKTSLCGKPERVSAPAFKRAWRDQPDRFDTSWEEIERIARKVIRHASQTNQTTLRLR